MNGIVLCQGVAGSSLRRPPEGTTFPGLHLEHTPRQGPTKGGRCWIIALRLLDIFDSVPRFPGVSVARLLAHAYCAPWTIKVWAVAS